MSSVNAHLPTCSGLSMAALSRGQRLSHNEAEVRDVVARSGVGPSTVTGVYPALVVDPIAAKISPDWGATPRPMWVIDGTKTVGRRPPEARGPSPVYPVGTVLRVITLVDDATLRLGGNFACGVVSK